MAKLTINLLQPDLLPKKPPLTLTRVFLIWGIVLLAFVFWAIFSQVKVNDHSNKRSTLTKQHNQQQQLLDNLQQQVSENRADPKLLARLENLKVVIANKQALHKQLTDQSKVFVSGFSSAMSELAEHHHKDVSLEQVFIFQEQLSFSGMAKTPDAVPQWLAGFKESNFLAGKTFSTFSLNENELGLTSFQVSSKTRTQGGAR
ncbi:PilN domain-containing protein [Thalassotalea ganghwensis]